MFDNLADNIVELTPMARNRTGVALDRVQVFLSLLVILALPFFFLPLTVEWFDSTKILFLGASVASLGLVTLIRLVLSPEETLVTTILDKILLTSLVVLVISAWMSPNRVQAALSEPTQWLYLITFFFLLVNTIRQKESWTLAFNLLIWSVGILGSIHIVQTTAVILGRVLPGFQTVSGQYSNLTGFTPVGTPYTLGLLLLLVFPLVLGKYLAESAQAKNAKTTTTTLLVIVIVSLAAVGWTLLSNRPIILDADSGRKIATGTLGKSYQNALFGIGPGDYVSAFNQFKGPEFNASPYWNFNFTTSSSFALYSLTIGGLSLIICLILAVLRLYSLAAKRLRGQLAGQTEKGIFASLGLALLAMIFLPIPYTVLWLTFTILGLLLSWYRLQEANPFTKPLNLDRVVQAGAVLVMTLTMLASLYGVGANYVSDIFLRQSLEAAAGNRGLDTYNLQVRAAQTAPWRDTVRLSLSQTNLALADALAGQPNLSDQQKQTVVQLIQQAILEARNAVALSPNNSNNWQNLALIYRNLINFAQGANEWAITSQNQAINLNPANPRLRLDMGGIFYAQNDWNSAAQQFSAAIALKPDFANAHYNLAQAFKQLNYKDQAFQQLQLTDQLVCLRPENKQSLAVDTTRTDCEKVKAEIADLAKPPEVATSEGTVAGETTVESDSQLEEPAGQNQNLPNAKTQPPVKIASPSGEITQ